MGLGVSRGKCLEHYGFRYYDEIDYDDIMIYLKPMNGVSSLMWNDNDGWYMVVLGMEEYNGRSRP